MSNKVCAVIAESPMCFKWGFDEEDERCCALKLLLLSKLSLLHANGITQFYVPLDAGICMYCAEILLSLMGDTKQIRLNCIQPFEDQATRWSPNLRDRYFYILEKCSAFVPISLKKTMTCELDGMLEAIDLSEIVIAVHTEDEVQDKTFATALRYARHIGREIIIITPPEIAF